MMLVVVVNFLCNVILSPAVGASLLLRWLLVAIYTYIYQQSPLIPAASNIALITMHRTAADATC